MKYTIFNTYLVINNLTGFYKDNKLFFYYLMLINIISFLLYGIDKIKASRKKWRIPENTLLGLSIIGGSLGGLLAMHIFRHKTKKPKFSIGIPILLVIHIAGLLLLN